MSFLIFGGKTGWIGQKIVKLLELQGQAYYVAESRMEDRSEILKEIQTSKPKYIINCAGITGTPTVDYCETHQIETIRSNIIGTLNLIDTVYTYGIHITNIGSGCIYEYNKTHPIGSGIGFKETDEPNFFGSFYSRTKAITETFARRYDNVLTLRIRMPIDIDIDHPKNLIGKLIRYQKVINIPNSVTILPDLLPIAIEMTKNERKGIYNFTNPGTLSHNEILTLYKHIVNPEFEWTNFTLEEQSRVLLSRRSNCHLDTSKLLEEYPNIKPASESLSDLLKTVVKKSALN